MANEIIDNRIRGDQTVRIFNQFYAFNLVVPTNEYDVVHGYFLDVCETKQIADNFTAFLFKISQETQTSALELLDVIRGTSRLDMNKIISYYLNSFKSKTALYGVAFIPTPNQSVQRNILQ
jgi:hypothetical protein